MTATDNGQIIFLKNKTIPIDKYETTSKLYNFNHVKFIPLIKHTNIPKELLTLINQPNYLSNLKYIIITSQRTVECLYLEILPKLSPSQQQALFDKIVYTVGPATGDFLRRCGFNKVKGDDMGNGKNLAEMMIKELDPHDVGKEILFLVGKIRTDIIKNKLLSYNFPIKEIITYETQVLTDNLQRFENEINLNINNWIVMFSPQGIDDIITYLKPYLKENNIQSFKIASIGPTTETFLVKNGIIPQVTSSKPTPESLLQLISSYH